MIRRPLVPAVGAALATAVGAGLLVSPPRTGAPDYALSTLVVWRLEVAAAVAAALYLAIVVVALAWEGQTISRLGPGGVDIPPRTGAATSSDAEVALRSVADILTAYPARHQSASAKHQMSGKRLRADQEGD